MFDDALRATDARAGRFGPMRDANACAKVRGACGYFKQHLDIPIRPGYAGLKIETE